MCFKVQLFIQCGEYYARCDWSLPMIYQSTDTQMTTRETCFPRLVQHGAYFENVWEAISD